MRPESDLSAVQTHAAADAAALVNRIDAEISQFVDVLTSQVKALVDHADVEPLRHQLRERDAEAERLKALLVKARMDLEAAKTDLAEEREAHDTAKANAARMTAEFDRVLDELRRDHAAALREQAATCSTLPLDELLQVFDTLTRATTAAELQAALLTSLAREFSRVALLHLDGARLVASERRGFSDEDTSKTIRLPADSLLAQAARTGRLESFVPGLEEQPRTSLPFGGSPGCAVALPIVLDNALTAVVYADDSDRMETATAPQARIRFAELVHRYALLVLLKISIEPAPPVDLRAFAASLVAEVEYNYDADAGAGRNRLECQHRLKTAVQMARRRYADRTRGDSDAAGLLDEQLASTLAARMDSDFGRDLEDLLSSRSRGGRVVAINRSR